MFKIATASLLFLLVASPASAAGKGRDHWTVTQLTGDARVIHPGLQPASLRVNADVGPGDTVVTGNSGRATLVHGKDYILVAPNSEMRLPRAAQPTGFTRIIETLGTILYKVEHTAVPHFAVETPMLAAVVKGTTFTVVVDRERTSVDVIQGIVQVSAADGGMARLVQGGGAVSIENRNPAILRDVDKTSTDAPSSTAIEVSASGWTTTGAVAKSTGGLVDAGTETRRILVTTELLEAAEPTVGPWVVSTGPGPVNASISTGSGPGGVTASVTTPSVTTSDGTASVTTPAVSTPIVSTSAGNVTTSPTPTASVAPTVVSTPPLTVSTPLTPAVPLPPVTVALPPVTVPPVTTGGLLH